MEQRSIIEDQQLTKLHEIELNGMAEVYQEHAMNQDSKKMRFEERFDLQVDL